MLTNLSSLQNPKNISMENYEIINLKKETMKKLLVIRPFGIVSVLLFYLIEQFIHTLVVKSQFFRFIQLNNLEI